MELKFNNDQKTGIHEYIKIKPHTHILRLFSYFYKECYWDLDRNCIKSVDHFEKYRHFHNIDYFRPETQNDFPLIILSLISFMNVLQF